MTNQKGIEETFIHSVIHLLTWSGSQPVNKFVREACAVGIVFWIRSEIGYRKPHTTPLFFGLTTPIEAIDVQFYFIPFFPIFAKKKTTTTKRKLVDYTPVSKNQNKE